MENHAVEVPSVGLQNTLMILRSALLSNALSPPDLLMLYKPDLVKLARTET